MDKLDFKKFNKILIITLIGIMVGILVIILNYLGIISLVVRVFKAIIPVFIAIIISFLFEPLVNFFERRKIKRNLSVLIVYGLILLLILLILVLFIPPLFLQIKQFLSNLPSIIEQVNILFKDILDIFEVEDISVLLKEIVNSYSKNLFNDISGVVSDILYLFMAYVGALFLSFDYNSFKRKTRRLLPKKIRKPVVNFFEEYLPFIYKYLRGILYDTFLLWALSTFAFFITGLEYAIVYGLILSIFNLIPIVGSYIGGIPAILVALTISPLNAIYVFISVVIVQTIESNFMNPYIMKNVIKLHPLEGLFSLLLLGSLFGFVGMVISPLFWVAFKLIIKQYKESRVINAEGV